MRRRIQPLPSDSTLDRSRYRADLALALEADVDVRTAQKALREGAHAIRGRARERLELAAATLGIVLPPPEAP